MKKFLVIQTAFIGDAILATAVLEKLHLHYANAQIDYLVRKGNEALFDGHPYIKNLLVWDKKGGKYRNLLKLLKVVRGECYDVVINLQRFAATGLLTVFSGAKTTVGFNKNPLSRFFSLAVPHETNPAKGVHEIARNQLLIKQLTDEQPAKPRLYVTQTVASRVSSYLTENFVCIAPASVWFTKQLPAEKWAEFINAIPATVTIYLLGAPQENSLHQSITQQVSHRNIFSLAGKLSLLESAALMQHANMNYVNDSAPLHLASSLNAPVTAVYCSTVPGFGFGPLSDVSFIVQTEKPLACKPCGLHGHKACPMGHFECALTINSSQLLKTLPPHQKG